MLAFAVASLATIVRLAHVLYTVDVPTSQVLLGDAAGYNAWSMRIAAGEWYGTETFYQAPLYPYFLALLRLGPLDVTGLRLAQAVLGGLATLVLAYSARQRFGATVGIVAAAMFAVYAPAIYYDGILQKTSLASFLLCGFLCAVGWMHHSRRRRVTAAVIAGVTLGLLVLTRENALLWIPFVAGWAWWTDRPTGRSMGASVKNDPCEEHAGAIGTESQAAAGQIAATGLRYRLLAGILAGLTAILLPVAARNASLGGEWSPTTFQAGPNFYIGNNLTADGIYRPLVPGHETPFYERTDAVRIAEAESNRELTPREVSLFWLRRAWQEIRTDPVRWVKLLTQKCFLVLNAFEVPDVESLTIYREYSPILSLDRVWHFGTLLPLAAFGACLIWRQRENPSSQNVIVFLDLMLAGLMIVAVVGFFILGRYRFPLVPILIPFASYGLVRAVRACRRRRGIGELKLPVLVAILAAVASNIQVVDQSGLAASSMMNAGIAAAQKGDVEQSLRLLESAVIQSPGLAEGYYNLGRTHLLRNDPTAAIQSLQTAGKLDPKLPMVDLLLGRVYLQMGDHRRARRYLGRASEFPSNRQQAEAALRQISAPRIGP